VRIYINAQFWDGNHRTRLISLGMVSELGEWYRILDDQGGVEHARRDPWILYHVLGPTPYDEEGRDWLWSPSHADSGLVVRKEALVDDMLDFVDAHTGPELWGWQSAYAYTCIRHLFGSIRECPANFPEWCGELAAEWVKAGRPDLPPRGKHGHHALDMARWAMQVHQLLGN
jgi:hypothetical protein